MATLSTTNPASIADEYQTYFSKQLLDYAVQGLRKAEFGKTAPLPKNAGAQTIRFFRFNEPSAASVVDLTEGTAMASSAYRELTLAYVEATLNQVGQVIAVTDVLNATSLLNIMSQAIKTNGEDAALYCDNLSVTSWLIPVTRTRVTVAPRSIPVEQPRLPSWMP